MIEANLLMMSEHLPEAEPDAAGAIVVPGDPVDAPEAAVVVVPAEIADPPVAATGPVAPGWALPVPRALGKQRGGWWFLGGLAVGIGVAGVALLPLVREELKQRNLSNQATRLVATAHEQLRVGQLDAAESSAREALQLIDGYVAAKQVLGYVEAEQVVASVKLLRERNRRREQDGAAALAAAEKLAAGDDILAALAAFRGISGRSFIYGEAAVALAKVRVSDLAEVTATLRLPADWPDDVVVLMDRKPMRPEDGMIAGIPLRSHQFEVSRPGYRPQPQVKLQFGGRAPVDFPEIDWQMIGGTVVITSVPAGAVVWSDGKDTGKTTPCVLEQVEVGEVNYLLKLKAHVDASLTGLVGNLKTLELASTLAERPWLPKPGKVAGERREFNLTPDLRVAFRWCPAGAFVMGEAGPVLKKRRKPTRRVELSVGYWLAETEFTQRQWAAVLGHDELLQVLLMTDGGSVRTQLDHPMRLASWDRVCGNKERSGGLLGKINAFFTAHKVAGWEADLPTEAQWEYACRAGGLSLDDAEDQSAAGLDRMAWHRDNSGKHLQAVAQKDANLWGLRDMHGNIAEWCRDWFVEAYDKQATRDPAGPPSGWKKCLRGGSWLSSARSCGSSIRMEAYPSTAHPAIGFRLMLRSGKPRPPAGAPAGKARPKKAPAKRK